jgi:succinate dehydrogenase / fumarate reductase iron-sulfur subunit
MKRLTFRSIRWKTDPNERLLDALMQVKRFQDGSLGFRKSCAHGVCGSDAMRINGKDGLACKTLVKEVVEKDGDTVGGAAPVPAGTTGSDRGSERLFQKIPFGQALFDQRRTGVEKERIQSQEERLQFDDTTNCILCASCYSACPVLDENTNFLGPAAIAQAYRFLADTRDRGFEARFPVLDHPDGVWPCQNHFQCTQSCPRSS